MDRIASFTARAQQNLLNKVLQRAPEGSEGEQAPPSSIGHARSSIEMARRTRIMFNPWTLLKSLIAVLALLGLGWMPVQRLLATTSAEAIINSHVITIRAPIEGGVTTAAANLEIGTLFTVGEEILTVTNPRVDPQQLNTLKRTREQLRNVIIALETKRRVLETARVTLANQQEAFRSGRIKQLEKRLSELDTQVVSANAQHLAAAETLRRANTLKTSGFVRLATVDQAVRDERVALEAVNGLVERGKGMSVELDAARHGTFIGDSYNDTPQSSQRWMDVTLELADVTAKIEGTKRELANVQADLEKEQKRQNDLSTAVLHSPISGRVWEVLTSPGEHVNAGQDLLRVLDCGWAIVTASVSEANYQRLWIGQKARFKPRNGGSELAGSIVGLNGLAAVGSSSAIQQNALVRERYYVTLKFPALAGKMECQVGHTGLVTFDTVSAQNIAKPAGTTGRP